MLFQTLEFWSLFLFVLPLNFVLRGTARRLLLLGVSYLFYSWFSVPLVGLMVFSTVLDYTAGRGILRARSLTGKRLWLGLSLLGNLGVLFFFKYTNWFLGSVNSVSVLLTGKAPFPFYDIILPLGISFYTFQTLSYSIDIYRGKITESTDIITFALFVSFFPQLVAGPIVRAADLIPQLRRGPRYDERSVLTGIALVGFGLLKKVVIADNLAAVADLVYASPGSFGGFENLVGVWAFAFQIYCDFSGYTDIARGIGRLLGFDLGENFRQPYFAAGIRDFWRRWHISLSTWLRDYLYISVGGNRGPRWYVVRNVMITMLLGGLWHGASWTFVAWGALHGVWISAERFLGRKAPKTPDRRRSLGVRTLLTLATFQGVCVSWVFFRASSFSDAVSVFTSVARAGSGVHLPLENLIYIPLILAVDGLVIRRRVREWFLRHPLAFWSVVWVTLVVVVCFGVSGANEFIYFQF